MKPLKCFCGGVDTEIHNLNFEQVFLCILTNYLSYVDSRNLILKSEHHLSVKHAILLKQVKEIEWLTDGSELRVTKEKIYLPLKNKTFDKSTLANIIEYGSYEELRCLHKTKLFNECPTYFAIVEAIQPNVIRKKKAKV